MKKLTISAVALLAMALAFAGIAVAKGPGPKATGGGKAVNPNTGFTVTFGVNAQNPASPKGQVNIRVDDDGTFVQHYTGSVDCYFQNGNFARFSGEVTNLELGTNTNPAMFFEVRVVDNGEPGAGGDLMFHRRVAGPIDCEGVAVVNHDVIAGNIQVHQSGPPGRP